MYIGMFIYISFLRKHMNYQDEGKVIFNEGVAITYRLDDIQKQITLCSLNPGAMNPVHSEFNYKLWLRLLIALQREISADLDNKKNKKKEGEAKDNTEQKEAEEMREAIIKFEKKHPVYKSIKMKVSPYSTKLKRDDKALSIIVEKLNEYGTYLNSLKKKHGYGNPTQASSGSAMAR